MTKLGDWIGACLWWTRLGDQVGIVTRLCDQIGPNLVIMLPIRLRLVPSEGLAPCGGWLFQELQPGLDVCGRSSRAGPAQQNRGVVVVGQV